MIKLQDLTGNRYGRLTVVEQAPSFITPSGKKQIAWKVLCDCGTEKIVRGCDLKSGYVVSCGCYNKSKDIGKKKYKDLSGERFGRLTVNSYAYTKNNRAYWNCKCDCGNSGIFIGKYLLNGDTKSCGCQKQDNAGIYNAINLEGQRFSRLLVQGLAQRKPRKWKCLCDCGNQIDVLTNCLISGHTQSCGCMQSTAELKIASILKKYDIKYQQQKSFIGCKDAGILRFDFYIPSMNIAIEYDGKLHYMETSLNNDLKGQQRRDLIKTKYCEENDIILLRIPYWEKDNIESILKDWLFLYDNEEAGGAA